jgi:4-alpha-glucanotransferase
MVVKKIMQNKYIVCLMRMLKENGDYSKHKYKVMNGILKSFERGCAMIPVHIISSSYSNIAYSSTTRRQIETCYLELTMGLFVKDIQNLALEFGKDELTNAQLQIMKQAVMNRDVLYQLRTHFQVGEIALNKALRKVMFRDSEIAKLGFKN